MTAGRAKAANALSFTSGLDGFLPWGCKSRKTHDFTPYQNGLDYVFDSAEQESQRYMTGQGKGIRQGDFLLLKLNNISELYEVRTIDYYAAPPDAWMALLAKARPVN